MPTSPSHSVYLEVESLEDRRVLSTSTFVSGLYTVLLHRTPSPAEVAPYVAAIDQGGLSPTQAALAITSSPEYKNDLVVTDYQRLLGRSPGPTEAVAWTGALENGLTATQLAANLLASPEYFQKHGNTTNTWLNAVYKEVLGRPLDPAAQANYDAALQQGAAPLTVTLGIVQSPESYQRIVTAAFEQVLGRAPDPGSLNAWTANMLGGMTPSQLQAFLASSNEFIADQGGLDAIQPTTPVPVRRPVFVPEPFFPGPVYGFGGTGFTTTGFTGGGFTGGFTGGFSGGFSGGGFSGGSFS